MLLSRIATAPALHGRRAPMPVASGLSCDRMPSACEWSYSSYSSTHPLIHCPHGASARYTALPFPGRTSGTNTSHAHGRFACLRLLSHAPTFLDWVNGRDASLIPRRVHIPQVPSSASTDPTNSHPASMHSASVQGGPSSVRSPMALVSVSHNI
jgi:hypothetical protein